jgi:uncharacterized protein
MKILVTGATGLIGKNLCQRLYSEGHEIVVLTRKLANAQRVAHHRAFVWQPETEVVPAAALADVNAVIHLVGESVSERWTDERKRSIRASRVASTRNLVQAMRQQANPPRIFISGSAVGIYGSRGDELLPETAAASQGFLGEVCQAWEFEACQAEALNTRVVLLRTGVVLDPAGGALKTMLPAFNLGIAGKLASGRQWFPWIHQADIVGLICHALHNEKVVGPLNGVAPNPVTNEEFTKELAAVLNRPALIPVPKLALDLLFGEMATVILASQRVIPRVALETGYQFIFPRLHEALVDLLQAPTATQTQTAAASHS